MKRIVPFKESETEIRVVNSRFIASLSPADSVEAARLFVREIKEKYKDASHNVPAYIIGHGKSVTAHCNDDGEPSGTAGRPALAVLQGSGLGNVVVVVTRYFGGTKLGTGGLVRAYGDAVREVLKKTERAEIVKKSLFVIKISYPYYEPVKRVIEQSGAEIIQEDFTEIVQLKVSIIACDYESIHKRVVELTSNQAVFQLLEENVDSFQRVRD